MNSHIAQFAVLPLALAAAACGGTAAGTQPHDMSQAQHEAAASSEEKQASEHAVQHDPHAAETKEKCSAGRGNVCWTETTNPTSHHGKTAGEHRELAGKHRAASKALQDAEAKACVGIPDEDRDMSPFAHAADIESVSQLQDEQRTGKSTVKRDAGATIVFRATPGLTAEWLQRVVDCHMARNSSVGHDMPEMTYCPLVPKGAKATVRSVGDGFAVDVRSDDAATASEIWKRAQQVKAAP